MVVLLGPSAALSLATADLMPSGSTETSEIVTESATVLLSLQRLLLQRLRLETTSLLQLLQLPQLPQLLQLLQLLH